MPRRSNPFQRLVRLIEEDLIREGTVEESVMVDSREIDLLIEVEAGEMTFRIAVECRDHSRSQPVGWVEELIGKYNGLSTEINKVLAVSSTGFTSGARERAEDKDCSNIELLSLAEAESVDWGQLRLLSEEVSVTEVKTALINRFKIDITALHIPDKLVIERPKIEELVVEGTEKHDSFQDYLWDYLESNFEKILEREVYPEVGRVAKNFDKWEGQTLHLSFDWDFEEEEIVLLSSKGIRYRVPAVRLHFLLEVTQKTLTLGESVYRDVRVLSDAASLGENSSEVSVAFTEREDTGNINLGLNVSSAEDEWTLKFEDMSLQSVSFDFMMFAVSEEVIDLPEGSAEGGNDLPEHILKG